MKRIITFHILLVICQLSFAQLNCKTLFGNEGDKTIKCYHKNGKLSSIEIWDKNKREGSIKCYTNTGKEIINYDLRRFAGHASVYLDYYTNGQIKKAEYSSAPDGGIQFYHTIYKFDEAGTQIDFQDFSQPDGHPTLFKQYDTNRYKPAVVKPTTKKQEVIACAIPYITTFEVINESKKKVTIQFKAQKNLWVQLKDTAITLKPKQITKVKSVILAQMFLKQEEAYQPEIVGSKKEKLKYKIITAQPEETNQTKAYKWHIIRL